jgi:hypothetical protein
LGGTSWGTGCGVGACGVGVGACGVGVGVGGWGIGVATRLGVDTLIFTGVGGITTVVAGAPVVATGGFSPGDAVEGATATHPAF